MTDATVNSLIVAVPVTLTALAGLIVSIRNGAKSDVIVGHVNSAAAASKAEIEGLRNELRLVREERSSDVQKAALLAQAAATKSVEPPVTEPVPVSVANPPEKPVPTTKGKP